MKDKAGNDITFNDVVKRGGGRVFNVGLEFLVFILHLFGHIPIHTVRHLAYSASGVRIGRGSTIHTGAIVYDPRGIEVGEDTIVGERSVLDGRDRLIIGNHVAISSEVMIYNSQHDVHDPSFKAITKPVRVDDYVFIGPRAIILPGITIGRGAVVAAGAIVTKDVEPFTIVAGVPAVKIGERKAKDLKYKLGRPRLFR